MKQHGYSENKEHLIKRLSRVEGQIRGICKMVIDDRYCIDILTQISAARAALDKVAIELIRDHAHHCLTTGGAADVKNEKANELADAIGRML
jgi:CsoR family transcriptional regulator, copper-sensing transcriptional repressor